MPNPATFSPLVLSDEYTQVEHDPGDRFGDLPEGTLFEHYRVTLDNGYVVSVCRTNLQADNPSIGWEDGLWEAATMRKTHNPMARLLGLDFEPAPELDELNTHEPEPGVRVIGNLDNEGVNALLADVAARPAYVEEESDFDPFELLFGPADHEESAEGEAL